MMALRSPLTGRRAGLVTANREMGLAGFCTYSFLLRSGPRERQRIAMQHSHAMRIEN